MGKVLEYGSVLGQQLIEHRFSIVLVSSPKNVMVGASYISNRIQLHKTKVFNQLQKIKLSSGLCGQANSIQPEPSGIAVIDFYCFQFLMFTCGLVR